MEKIVVSCLESRIDENQSVYSRFLLGPFLSGHAVTVATALRRALLSEVKNIAITALHIQGVTHEFSTVVGIRESVLELSLNFQQVILSTQTKPKSVQIGYLHVQGPAIVHANDLKLPDGIECVNPTQYIATLSTEGLLVVKFLIAGKKSFLKSNTSTLNSKKIKQAKAYSAQLSHSLLSHAEYDPPRVFRLLRNQSLPNGTIARRSIEDANLLRASQHRLLSEAEHPFDKSNVSSVDEGDNPSEPNLVLKEPNLVEPSSTKVSFLAEPGKPTQNTEAGTEIRLPPEGATTRTSPTTHSVGEMGLEPDLEVPRLIQQRGDSLSRSESATIIDADPNLDQLACSASLSSRTYDEFNSEVCLRTIIPLDPIFTPVYQVNFGIERDDLSNQIRERVIMEVWTNGSIHPRQAINEAALSTMSIFSKLRKTFQLDSHSLALCANSTVPFTNRRFVQAGFAPRGASAPRPGTKFRLPSKGARGSRLHKTKSIVKSGLLNDDATESLEPLARRAFGSLALSSSGQLSRPEQEQAQARHLEQKGWGLAAGVAHWRPVTRERFARVTQEKCVNYRRFALSKPSVTKLDLTSLVGLNKPPVCSGALAPKFKSFSSFGFVRSRHPVLAPSSLLRSKSAGNRNYVPAIFLQNFGKSHIRGQTFLLEQSFGLKARFFKGHCAVLSKAMYTWDDHTFKRTFLPSFKVVLGCLGANRTATLTNRPEQTEAARLTNLRFVQASYIPPTTKTIRPSLTRPKPQQNRAGLTKAALLFQLRFCLADTIFQGLPLPSSCSALLPRYANKSYAFVRPGPVGAWSKNRAVGGLSISMSCPPSRTTRRFVIARLSEAGQVVQQPKPKPTLFLIKYRSFSFTRNALRLFGCKQDDSSFLLPLAKQLIRVKMARVFTSCLPLMSKKSESSLRFRFTETQVITTVEGSGRFDVKQILLSLAQSALGLQKNSYGSENFAERGALVQNQKLRSANGGAIETSRSRRDLLVPSESDEFVQASSADGVVSPTYGRQLANPARTNFRFVLDRNRPEQTEGLLTARYEQTEGLLPVAPEGGQKEAVTGRRRGTFRLPSKGPKSFLSNRLEQTGRRRPAGWPKGGLELRAPKKRIASSIALRAITPFGRKNATVTRSATSKLWLRSNLKKQFGFFQFASNGLRNKSVAFVRGPRFNKPEPEQTGRRRGFGLLSRLQSVGLYSPVCSGFVQGSRPRRGLEHLGVCVNRAEPLTNRSRAVTKPSVLFAVRSAKRSWRAPLDFTTFPLMMTKVPPLCLPSGLVTLISSPSQEYRRPARSVRVSLARRAQTILADQVRRRRLDIWPPLGATVTGRRRGPFRPGPFRGQEQGLKSERAASEVRRDFSAAHFFGLNSDASVRTEFLAPTGQTELRSAFQLTTQAETDRAGGRLRLSAQGSKRLSILYSSNLDKMSFLSSDLANLSLSLKTYTFLKKKGKKNIASLLEYSPNTLFSLLNGDEKMFHDIERCFFFLGLPLKTNLEF